MLIGEIIAFLFVGLVAGLLGGMFGIGGGIIFVPFQILIYNMVGVPLYMQMKLAVGTSLLTTACTTFASAHAHAKHKVVKWELIYKIAVGVIFGALLGSFFGRMIPGKALEVIFGAVLCTLSVYLFFFVKQVEHETGRVPNFVVFNLVGLGIGTISAMLGVSGGFMTVPILIFFHISIRHAIGTGSAIGFLLSSVGAIGYLFPDLEQATYKYAVGYLYIPAFVPLAVGSILSARWGVALAHKIPMATLKKVLAVVLFIIGIIMIAR